MIDLSRNIYVKRLCKTLAASKQHADNVATIDNIVRNSPDVDWYTIFMRCKRLVDLYVSYYGYSSAINLYERNSLSKNLLSILKRRHKLRG